MKTLRLLTLLSFLGLAAGCSNPVCGDSAAGRLFRDCNLVFSSVPAAFCGALPGAPEDLDAWQAANAIALCEIADPSGDVGCYETVDCDALADGTTSCADRDDTPSSAARIECIFTCAQEGRACAEDCGNRPDFDACETCGFDCAASTDDCLDACPD